MKIGMDAIIAAGFPHEFNANCMLASHDLGSSVALRAGQPPNTGKGYAVAFKPMELKTKTCSTGDAPPFLAGFIAWDQHAFGRRGSKPIPKDKFKPVSARVSLQELLSDVDKGLYTSSRKGNTLEFRALSVAKASQAIVFRIDLTQVAGRCDATPAELTPWQDRVAPAVPDFWDSAWGKFDPDSLYEVSQRQGNDGWKPVRIAATQDDLPVTGDADQLWIAPSVALMQEFKDFITTYHNSYQGNADITNMTEDYLQLRDVLRQRIQDPATRQRLGLGQEATEQFVENIKARATEFAQTAGSITPFEFLMTVAVNDAFKEQVTTIKELFQHGPENNNPGDPSPLDGDVLHFFNGIAYLTESEDELIEFVLREGYLEQNFVAVHPGWNMTKWADVITVQLQLNQAEFIRPETMIAYKKEMQRRIDSGVDTTPARSAPLESNLPGLMAPHWLNSVVTKAVELIAQLFRPSSISPAEPDASMSTQDPVKLPKGDPADLTTYLDQQQLRSPHPADSTPETRSASAQKIRERVDMRRKAATRAEAHKPDGADNPDASLQAKSKLPTTRLSGG